VSGNLIRACEPTKLREPPVVGAATYAAVETLRDGLRVEIRALQQRDRAGFLAAVAHTSCESLYSRFFYVKRGFTERETDYFLNVDFIDHVALVAVVEEAGRSVIVGGARYIVQRPGTAEVAFTVVDQYQGLGIGTALMRHLSVIAHTARLRELIAEVLPWNEAMLKVLARSGFPLETKRESDVIHVALTLNPTPPQTAPQ
jgi:RimJ/RimL family protein N-acetyltransferase